MSDLPTPETITCPSCGSAQAAGAQFCTNCGALLTPTANQTSDSPPYGGAPSTPPSSVPFEAPVRPGGGYSAGGPPKEPYPVSLEFNGPEELSRLSTFFRLIVAIPLFIFLAVLGSVGSGVMAGLVMAHWLSLLVRKGRPVGWIGSAIVALLRFHFRAYAYLLLITDKYPAFEGDWFLQVDIRRPERISRRQIFFWKTLAVLPHIFCLIVLWFAVAFCEVVGWFAILFTGRFPKGLQNFVVGYMRWALRVTTYWISLRDEFPPYSLAAEATAGSRSATGFSALGGVVAAVVIGVGGGVAYFAVTEPKTEHVSYAELTAGKDSPTIIVDNVEVQLTDADDDYAFPGELLEPGDGERFVMIETGVFNGRVMDFDIDSLDFQLRDDEGDHNRPVFASVGGVATPAELDSGDYVKVLLVFEVTDRADVTEFRYGPASSLKDARFMFD